MNVCTYVSSCSIMAGTIALIKILLLTKLSRLFFLCVYGFLSIFDFADFIIVILDAE
jgi:hypothetical protein